MRHGVRLIFQVGPGGEFPIVPQPQALPVKNAALSRQQFPHIPENTLPRRPARADQKQLRRALRIHLRRNIRVPQNCFDLRGEYQGSIRRHRVKKRLYPHPIPGQKQRFPIPDRKGENAVQAVYTRGPPLHAGFQQHLRIRVTVKLPARFRQLPAQLRRVVQLSVVNQGAGLAVSAGGHGLTAIFRVHHAQSDMGQGRPRAQVDPVFIRPPPA